MRVLSALLSIIAVHYIAPAAYAQNAPSGAAETANTLITQQPIILDRTERMTVPVRINGSAPFRFVVDTGAERTVISHDLAAKLSLAAGPLLNLATVTGPTKAPSFVIDELAMNSVKVNGIEAPAFEHHNLGAHGLLGIDSLEDHKILLDFKNDNMEVISSAKRKNIGRLEEGMIVVRASRKAGRMILSNARIGNIKVDIILDTGAQSSMGNLALKDRLRRRDMTIDYAPTALKSITGAEMIGDYSQIRKITVGGVTIKDLPITFSENYALDILGLADKPAIFLGMDALQLFDRVVIDFTNRRVGFDLPSRYGRDDIIKLNPL